MIPTLKVISPLILKGPDAFYKKEDAKEVTEEALEIGRSPSPSFSWYNRSLAQRVGRVAYLFFSIIVFPLGLYQLFHIFIGKNCVVRAANIPSDATPHAIDLLRKNGLERDDGFLYKRFSIDVNGTKIDVMIVGTPETLESSDAWVIHANGQGAFYEQEVNGCNDFKGHLANLSANGIVFNYPGVGRSGGSVVREDVIESTQAIIDLVIDKEKGFGAKEVYAWGHSLGGAIHLQAFLRVFSHLKSKENLSVVLALSRTFSKFSSAVEEFTGSKFLGHVVRLAGWELDSIYAAKKLEKHPQIHTVILQTTLPGEENYCKIANPRQILFDGVITAKASLAGQILDGVSYKNKTLLTAHEGHSWPLDDVKKLDDILKSKMPPLKA